MNPTHLDHLRLLERWPAFAEEYWWQDPERPDLGCFGTGYNSWGVQTNQKYLGALAVLAAHPDLDERAAGRSRHALLDRAVRALRYSLAPHVSGDHHCSDGTRWGHTWISALGVERMMHGVDAIEALLSDADREGVRRMLVSEADALLGMEVQGTPWARDGGNKPESNIWNGAILARTALRYPDEAHVPDWMEKAHRFLMNGISLAVDADDERIVAGRPVREWHVGANFFPNYALDHHGYLNVGYMVICLSNIAMFHFACALRGQPAPESLTHHAEDLWRVVKRLVFADGRLARIGGDSRQRYCYCQDYLIPALLFCAYSLGDSHAPELVAGALDLIRQEQAASGDGSFLSGRLEAMRGLNPYYYTRLESDKAVVLSMGAWWRKRHAGLSPQRVQRGAEGRAENAASAVRCADLRVLGGETAPSHPEFEDAVVGSWEEPEHGAMLHRSRRRLASWSWRAREAPQGLCLPPASGHLAEWCENLGGRVRLLGETGARAVLRHRQWSFAGGFLTTGAMADSARAVIPEGWVSPEKAVHQFAVAALPDERTMVVLEFCRLGIRTYLAEVKGLKLNVPNDLFNAHRRTYRFAGGERVLRGDGEGVVALDSAWVNVEDTLGVVGLYGGEGFSLFQAGRRRASGYGESLYYDEVCSPCRVGTHDVPGGTVVLDCGSAVLSGASAAETESLARAGARSLACDSPLVRAVEVAGADGRRYVLAANFGETPATVTLARPLADVVTGRRLVGGAVEIAPGEAVLAGEG